MLVANKPAAGNLVCFLGAAILAARQPPDDGGRAKPEPPAAPEASPPSAALWASPPSAALWDWRPVTSQHQRGKASGETWMPGTAGIFQFAPCALQHWASGGGR